MPALDETKSTAVSGGAIWKSRKIWCNSRQHGQHQPDDPSKRAVEDGKGMHGVALHPRTWHAMYDILSDCKRCPMLPYAVPTVAGDVLKHAVLQKPSRFHELVDSQTMCIVAFARYCCRSCSSCICQVPLSAHHTTEGVTTVRWLASPD